MAKKENKKSFEHAIARLESIVQQLEQGDVPLEDSMKMFEEGIQLSNDCLDTLKKSELKIKQMTKDLNGKFQISEFNVE